MTANERADQAGSNRTVLFLQGVASPFFSELGRELRERGHRVLRINFCAGDRLFWPLGGSASYRGRLEGWPAFLDGFLSRHGVTDLGLFGDNRPYHEAAIAVAARHGLPVHVFEEGYLRPYWITVERDGVNGHSSFPRDPEEIRRLADGLNRPEQREFRSPFAVRAAWDVAYNVASLLGRPFYPGYRRHRPDHPVIEYAGWMRRIARMRSADKRARDQTLRLATGPGGFFLVPLQLDSDYQIRRHSRFRDLGKFLDEVMASFARAGPPGAELLVKVHPFDPGLVDRRAQADAIATRHGIASRVTVVEGGHLPTMLNAARGVVVVNSTVGTSALEFGRPTIALGTAIYDMPGLTFQAGLDRFWTEGGPPDQGLFEAFRTLIVDRTQVNGGFFSADGIAMAVGPAADRLLPALSPRAAAVPQLGGDAGPSRIVITGASRGIGAALAAAYARPGVSLALIGRNVEALTRVARMCETRGAAVEIIPLDVRDRDTLASRLRGFDDVAPVDLVIANAGVALSTGRIPGEDAAAVGEFEVNVLGVLNTVGPLAPPMAERGRGQIALMSSIAAFVPLPSSPGYSASKRALLAYGLALRERLGPAGVRVSVICPGFVDTDMGSRHKGWRPLAMCAERAATRIRQGLAADRAVIAFPRRLALLARFAGALPGNLRRAGLSAFRFRVDRA